MSCKIGYSSVEMKEPKTAFKGQYKLNY